MGIVSYFKKRYKEAKCQGILRKMKFWVELHEKAVKNGKDEALLLALTMEHIAKPIQQLGELDCLDSDKYERLCNALNEWLIGKRRYSKQEWADFWADFLPKS